jgi:hypothetical protein
MGSPGKRLIDSMPFAPPSWKLTLLGVLPPCSARKHLEVTAALVIHREQFSRVFRLVKSLRNDQRNAVAHATHEIMRQHRNGR